MQDLCKGNELCLGQRSGRLLAFERHPGLLQHLSPGILGARNLLARLSGSESFNAQPFSGIKFTAQDPQLVVLVAEARAQCWDLV